MLELAAAKPPWQDEAQPSGDRYSRIGSVQDGAGFELFTPGRRANCVAHRRAKPGTEPTVSITFVGPMCPGGVLT